MADLYDIPVKDAINSLVEDVIKDQEFMGEKVTKAKAKILVLNALMYNVVSNEVCNQVRCLCGQDIE